MVSAGLGLALLAAGGRSALASSPYLVQTPEPGACDVIVNEANAGTTLAQLDDPAKRVFCVEAGDYRSAGALLLSASGAESSRRFLRFHATDGVRSAVHRSERAIFESIRVHGSWWVVQGISVQPVDPDTTWFFAIQGGDHNVLERSLVDGSEHANVLPQVGIYVGGRGYDPGTHNVVQTNVVRSGNASRISMDYAGIVIPVGLAAGVDNDFNKILDNEVSDWGDGIALAGFSETCEDPGQPHGTVIDGNDVYITAAKRVDCVDGTPDPDGDCSCSENGIDVKPDPGADPEAWTRVTNNRLWGFRPTRSPSCGGTGSHGQAIAAGNSCAGHVVVAGNVVLDSSGGITVAGQSWIVAGNLFHEVRVPGDSTVGGTAVAPLRLASDLQVQFNTIVGVDKAYDDLSANTDTRCNVVVDNLALGGLGGTRGANHVTEHNFLYQSPAANFEGPTNETFATAEESEDTQYCFWRKRWTDPELVCVPFAKTMPESPHVAATPSCDADLGAPFGLGPISYDSIETVPEPGSTLLACSALLALAVRAGAKALSPSNV
jgi:hypothetical protein